MSEFFDRYVEIHVGSALFTLDDFDIEFSVENDEEDTAGQAEIAFYNLASSKSALKKDELVQAKAGYRDDYGIIFYGKIDKVWSEKDGADVKTIVQASDMTKQLFEAVPIVKKYPAGTSIASIVSDLLSIAAIPVGKIEDPGLTLKKDMVFGGKTTSTPYVVLTEEVLPLVNGAVEDEYTFYVKDGMGYFVKRDFKEQIAIVLDAESGLLEVQEVSEDDQTKYRVRCLLNWKIRQGTLVQLNSSVASGNFKVTKFKHVCKGEEYFTEAEIA